MSYRHDILVDTHTRRGRSEVCIKVHEILYYVSESIYHSVCSKKHLLYLTYKTAEHNEMRLGYHVQFLRWSAALWFYAQSKGRRRRKGNKFLSKCLDVLWKNDRRGSCSDIKGSVEGKLKCFAIRFLKKRRLLSGYNKIHSKGNWCQSSSCGQVDVTDGFLAAVRILNISNNCKKMVAKQAVI